MSRFIGAHGESLAGFHLPSGNATFPMRAAAGSSRFVTAKIIPRRGEVAVFPLFFFFHRRKTPTNARRLVAEQLHRGLTAIRCLKPVAILVYLPVTLFFPSPFTFSWHKVVTYPRRSPEGASSFLRVFSSATAFGPREFRNHFRPANQSSLFFSLSPPPSLSLSLSLSLSSCMQPGCCHVLHGTCVREILGTLVCARARVRAHEGNDTLPRTLGP